MERKKRFGKSQRGSILIMFTLALPVFIAPLVGLGVDATVCYIVQTQLAAAVDGAALGAGRLLSTNANATDIATEFLNANFRVGQAGFWNSYNLTPTITVQTGTTKTVTVNAAVTVPLLFMRLIGQNTALVTATATATRRDARIEFVIDRSGSMTNSDGAGSTVIADLVNYAQGFTQQFTEGADELGLVIYDTDAVVGYPTTPWPATIPTPSSPGSPITANNWSTVSGGPDSAFQSGAATDMVHQIANVSALGGTGMGDALALAYNELEKAHMRDLKSNGADIKMNAIVLFTDGVPSAVSIYPNQKSNSIITAGSGCTYKTDDVPAGAPGTHPIYGAVVLSGSPSYVGHSIFSLYQLGSRNSSQTSAWFMSHPWDTSGDQISPPNTPSPTGCSSSGWSPLSGNLSAMPSKDAYGYSLAPDTSLGFNGYKVSSNTNGSGSNIYNGTDWSTTSPTDPYQWGLAGWDEADNVGEAIRSDSNYPNRTGDTSKMSITIYTVGYTGNGGTDDGLLAKLANTKTCSFNGFSCYNNKELAGLYISASDKTSLANAFSTIATAILRLAH